MIYYAYLPHAGDMEVIALYPRNTALKPLATQLRKNATPQENHLWYDFLRTYPLRFNRQYIIGNYIVDFYCARAKLVVELDGSQHYEPTGQQHDSARDEYLRSMGLQVLRIPNSDMNRNFAGVCAMIDQTVKDRCPR